MSKVEKYTAAKMFDGNSWQTHQTIFVEEGIIKEISNAKEQPDFELIIPAFVDLQVYGAGGRLLSAFPDTITLKLMHQYFRESGTAFFMPTVATNTMTVMYSCIDAVRSYWAQGGEDVLGLHLEGPWINPEKRGAHIESLIYSPTLNQVKEILEYGKGIIKMITIAPEICRPEILDYLLSQDILLSAGHSNASYEQAISAFNKGIPTITHLYNAMSGLQHRNTGMVGAAFLHKTVAASVIPDGIHVSYEALQIAHEVMGERLFAITDAVTETVNGPYTHQLALNKYESNGILSGSSLTMHQCLLNLINKVHINPSDAINMCTIKPANLAGFDITLKVGKKAKFLLLDTCYNIKKGVFEDLF